MSLYVRRISCLLCAAVLLVAARGVFAGELRPNIIVFYTDDHGYADLSCQGVMQDVRTPNVDALAASGARIVHGYSTAPQCVPSRAGLMIGKFQAKFGVESNNSTLEGFDAETTIAQRLQADGYVTAQFGKWHLGPTPQIPKHGFKYVYSQHSQGPFSANITLDGDERPMETVKPTMYHIDACSRAAASVIDRHPDKPLFLYVAYRAPHVPLDAPPNYLQRFPGEMPQRRRQALAMLSAVDDGVGLVMQTLEKHQLTDKTLIFYIGDNGAPLKITKADLPGGSPGWDGSLNDPLNGEKGMLTEGGMHVPFVVSWPGKISAGQQYRHPVTALDVAATATAVAGVETQPGDLDGVNLLPFLSGGNPAAPHEALYWRWIAQSAVREGKWKLLRGGDREYLFDLDADLEESHDLAAAHPEIATRLRKRLANWTKELKPSGLANGSMTGTWNDYYDFYLDGKPATLRNPKADAPAGSVGLWTVRGGTIHRTDEELRITPDKTGKGGAFITRSGLNLTGPVAVRLTVKTSAPGPVTVAWRTKEEKDFTRGNRIELPVGRVGDWQELAGTLPTQSTVIHVRIQPPSGGADIRQIEFTPTRGKPMTLAD